MAEMIYLPASVRNEIYKRWQHGASVTALARYATTHGYVRSLERAAFFTSRASYYALRWGWYARAEYGAVAGGYSALAAAMSGVAALTCVKEPLPPALPPYMWYYEKLIAGGLDAQKAEMWASSLNQKVLSGMSKLAACDALEAEIKNNQLLTQFQLMRTTVPHLCD